MLFLERPITFQNIRDFCGGFNEGVRVEYKSTLNQNVKDALPKIVSSFANSHGGVLIIGVTTQNGTPQPPFDGFAPPPREELPLTVENICLRNIYPPLVPRSTVVPSDIPGLIFLVIEVEESGESPHAIENSKRVFVRTGSAANPYDLAEVDLIIDLFKRRRDRFELRDHLLRNAEQRADQNLDLRAHFQISICPTFPRASISTSQEVWDFLLNTLYRGATFAPLATMRRVPDGVACLIHPRMMLPDQYMEVSKYGLLFVRSHFSLTPFNDGQRDGEQQLHFGDLFNSFFKLTVCAERFYSARGYRGSLLIRASLNFVRGRAMRFVPGNAIFNDENPDEYRCQADTVSVERLAAADQIGAQSLDVLIDMLSELTWAFWQVPGEYPSNQLRGYLEGKVREMGRI